MKFGHYIILHKKNFMKKLHKNRNQVPGSFVFAKNYAQPLLENEVF